MKVYLLSKNLGFIQNPVNTKIKICCVPQFFTCLNLLNRRKP